MEKAIVLIDDTQTQKAVLENLINHLRRKEGINALGQFINPIDKEYWNDAKDPDFEKLISGINGKLVGIKPDLIVIDQYYSGVSFKGLDIIKALRAIRRFKRTKIFLYSGNRDRIIREIFAEDSLSSDDKIKRLVQLIGYQITQFLDKDFKDEAIRVLKNVDFKDALINKLRTVENGKIHLFSPEYRNLTLEELANKIEAEDQDAPKILDEIFALTVSHYVKIDEGLQ